MSTITPPQRGFLDDLTWIRCIFCLKQFSTAQQFLVFECDAIACADCAKKIYSRADNRMNCPHCKKKVKHLLIREQMPPNIRKMFESPLKLGQEIVEIHNYQQRHRAAIQERVRAKVEAMKENVNEQRHQIQQCIRETEQIKASTVQHRQQIAKVISEDRLQQLLQLDEEQLKTLTFAQIKGTERRRRDSRQYDVAPMYSANTSTPSTFQPIDSRESCGSRSSSTNRSSSDRFHHPTQTIHPNTLVPQRRRSRNMSRDVPAQDPYGLHPAQRREHHWM